MSHRGVIRVTLRLSGRRGGDNLNFSSENATTVDRRTRRDESRGVDGIQIRHILIKRHYNMFGRRGGRVITFPFSNIE
jgi:hypothetical protein